MCRERCIFHRVRPYVTDELPEASDDSTHLGDPHLLKKYKARLVFVLGKVADDKVMTKIKMEYSHYGDIVQEDFMDSYRNLTYKGIAALKWITHHCRQASFAIKSDDDIMINFLQVTNVSMVSSLWTE